MIIQVVVFQSESDIAKGKVSGRRIIGSRSVRNIRIVLDQIRRGVVELIGHRRDLRERGNEGVDVRDVALSERRGQERENKETTQSHARRHGRHRRTDCESMLKPTAL